MQPITWNDVPSIHDVPELDESDRTTLEEIGDVLRRHGQERRFGVALFHQHCELQAHEILVEHCDPEQRRLVTGREPAAELIAHRYLPTIWRFDGRQPQACAYCPVHGDQHDGYKEPH